MYFLFVAFNNSCSFIFFQVILLDIYNDINAISLSITDNVLTRNQICNIVISDYNKGVITTQMCQDIILDIYNDINAISLSIIGNDENGRMFKKLLKQEGLEVDFLSTYNIDTTCKTRFVNDLHQQMLHIWLRVR